MNLKKYLKALLYFFSPFIILLFIIHTFYYFDIFSNNIMKYLKIVILIISSLASGFYIGLKSEKKGYLNGLILSSIIIVCLLISSLFLTKFKLATLIYYLIITTVITLGSMLGINRKK